MTQDRSGHQWVGEEIFPGVYLDKEKGALSLCPLCGLRAIPGIREIEPGDVACWVTAVFMGLTQLGCEVNSHLDPQEIEAQFWEGFENGRFAGHP